MGAMAQAILSESAMMWAWLESISLRYAPYVDSCPCLIQNATNIVK
jgi:hypothetical protein